MYVLYLSQINTRISFWYALLFDTCLTHLLLEEQEQVGWGTWLVQTKILFLKTNSWLQLKGISLAEPACLWDFLKHKLEMLPRVGYTSLCLPKSLGKKEAR